MKEERTPLQRAIIALGVGGVPPYMLQRLIMPKKFGEKAIERSARGAGTAGALSLGGAEIGGALGDDSLGSRAAGGALGGALGGAVIGGTNPDVTNLYKYLIQHKKMMPNKAAALLIGGMSALGAAGGAVQGMTTRPRNE